MEQSKIIDTFETYQAAKGQRRECLPRSLSVTGEEDRWGMEKQQSERRRARRGGFRHRRRAAEPSPSGNRTREGSRGGAARPSLSLCQKREGKEEKRIRPGRASAAVAGGRAVAVAPQGRRERTERDRMGARVGRRELPLVFVRAKRAGNRPLSMDG
jgi:hypothetical protein